MKNAKEGRKEGRKATNGEGKGSSGEIERG